MNNGPMNKVALLLACAAAAGISPAWAVPSFARQTGMTCAACHTVIPELTPFGREFKLNAYVIDNLRQIKGETMERRETLALNPIPALSMMVQVSYTHTGAAVPDSQAGATPGVPASALAKDGEVLLPQQASFFYAGKIANNLGAFMQLTYDGAADAFSIDNTDIRYARYIGTAEPVDGSGKPRGFLQSHDVLIGFTLNNNPTVQDPWNSTPAWGFPYAGSSVAPGPNAGPQVSGALAASVAGLGAYLWLDHAFYAELSAYTAAKVGGNHPLDSTQAAVPNGILPYWRVGYEWRSGRNSWFIGTYGMQSRLYPGNGAALSGPVDRYTDVAADTQYQFISDDHLFTLLASYIHEDQKLNASATVLGLAQNVNNDLHSLQVTAEYSFRRLIGGSVGLFSTSGSTDPLLYANDGSVGGSLTGSPDSRGYILEVNYLPFLNTKLTLQYVGYTRFNGGGTDYNGAGRSASDNNTLYALVWVNF